MPAEAPSQITVVRNSSEDVAKRQIVVYLDGERMGELLFGDSLTLPVASGRHDLEVDNTWNRKRLSLDVQPGEDLRFLAKSTAGRFSWFLLGFFGAGPVYVSIEPLAAS
jgi:hypothetical protein